MRGFAFIPPKSSLCVLGVMLWAACSRNSVSAQSGRAPTVTVSESDLGFSPPRLIRWVEAELSDEGRIAHYQGVCLVSLVVNDKGQPVNVHVVRPIGMHLDANAIEAAKQFRFIPAMEEDKPVPAKITVGVPFQLDPPSEGSAH